MSKNYNRAITTTIIVVLVVLVASAVPIAAAEAREIDRNAPDTEVGIMAERNLRAARMLNSDDKGDDKDEEQDEEMPPWNPLCLSLIHI